MILHVLVVWTLESKEIFIFGVAWNMKIVQIVDHINRSVGETVAMQLRICK
jgi:hypothetical protein